MVASRIAIFMGLLFFESDIVGDMSNPEETFTGALFGRILTFPGESVFG